MPSYCTVSEVKRWLPKAVRVEPEGADTLPPPNPLHPAPVSLTNAEIEEFIRIASSDIDARLSLTYEVPLKKVNIDGRLSYPPPIPFIAARFTAMLIFQQRLTGADRQDAEWVRTNYENAVNELQDVILGNERLLGQNSDKISRFAKSGWYPVPPYPGRFPPGRR